MVAVALGNALICAYRLGGPDGPAQLDSATLDAGEDGPGWLWAHLDQSKAASREWLSNGAGLDPLIVEALMAEETRPRLTAFTSGLLVILRGVNLNEGADPEDMIAARVWIDAKRIVTLRAGRLMAVQDVRDQIDQGEAPATPGAFLTAVAQALIRRMGPVLDGLDDAVAEIEDEVLESASQKLRASLSRLRRQAISLRRFLAPQREVLMHLHTDRSELLSDIDRTRLREVQDQLTRYLEELDSARDRAAVTQEELAGRMSEQMNKNMYVLSLVAGIFLPLGLLTGLLGINVGGIPGEGNTGAFAIVCAILVVIAVAVLVVFKRIGLW